MKLPSWIPSRLRRLLEGGLKGFAWVLLAVIAAVIGFVVENALSRRDLLVADPDNPSVAEITPTARIRGTAGPTETPEVTPPPTATPTPMATPTLEPEITASDGAEMVLVEAGAFDMGSEAGPFNEKPVHRVFVDAFYIDRYEVANEQYRACVEASVCTPSAGTRSATRADYFEDESYAAYPVVFISWFQAKTYCVVWREDSLPTEAQWEKAAGWDPESSETLTYPWGNDISGDDLFNGYGQGTVTDTVEAGSFEEGASPVGVYDMLGNVWEWVADWYSDEYYFFSPDVNPTGPETEIREETRVVRGGSWAYDRMPRVADREGIGQTVVRFDLGFRCARTVQP